jgi:hypothetical protein
MCKKRGGEEEKMLVVAHYTPTGLHRILYRICRVVCLTFRVLTTGSSEYLMSDCLKMMKTKDH